MDGVSESFDEHKAGAVAVRRVAVEKRSSLTAKIQVLLFQDSRQGFLLLLPHIGLRTRTLL